MDIKAKIEEIVEKAKNDETFHKELKSNPVKAIEDLLGVDLPDEQIKAVAEGVKAKMNLESAGGLLHSLEEKAEGLFHKK